MKKYNITILILTGMIATTFLFQSCQQYEKLIAVETGSVTNITPTSADIDAFVIDVGEFGAAEYGWCLSTSPNPTIVNDKINNGTTDSTGN